MERRGGAYGRRSRPLSHDEASRRTTTPHSGVGVVGGRGVYFGSGPQTRKVRNLAENPSVAVHPVGEDVLVLEGIAEVVTDPDPALAERVSAGPRPGCACGELENPVPLG